MLDRLWLSKDGRPDVLGKMRSDGGDEQSRDTDPIPNEVGVHADVGSNFAVPIAGGLELVKPVLQSIFVVGAAIVHRELYRQENGWIGTYES